MKYINRIIFVLIILLSINNTYAQTWNWVRSFGGVKSDKGIVVRVDKEENVIATGYFSNSMYMGNGITLVSTAGSSKQVFIAKYDKNGVCLWAKQGGNGLDDRVLGMDLDSAGNIYITGTSWNSITIGTINITSIPGCCDNGFVIKLDKDGNWIWGNSVSSNSGDDQGLDIVTDDIGNSYITGFMTGSQLYLGTSVYALASNSGSNVYNYYVAKINPSGVWEWGTTFGNLPYDPIARKYVERDIAICLDSNKNLYITGGYDGTRNFGSTVLTSRGGHDVFMMKADTGGNIIWAKSGGSTKDDWSNGISADEMGHVYITGEHRDSLLFDSMLIRNYDKRDVFVAKFNTSDGTGIWGKRAGSDIGSERGNDVYADKNCNVYVVGDVGAYSKFGPLYTDSIGYLNVFVSRISPDGDWMWVATANSSDTSDRGNSIVKGEDNKIYITGFFENDITIGNITINSNGKADAYIAKILDLDTINFCNEYYADTIPVDTIVPIDTTEDTTINYVNNIRPDLKIQVFPNPTKDKLIISVDKDCSATMYDVAGSLVIATKEKEIDMSSLRNGMYILHIKIDDIIINYKIIKI
jgi:hypothetical protein